MPLHPHYAERLQDIHRAIARMVYERRTGRDWHTADADPGTDPFYLGLALGSLEQVGDAVPSVEDAAAAIDRVLGPRPS